MRVQFLGPNVKIAYMTKKKIVIVGAGFGGITAALKLAKNMGRLLDEYEIVLLNRRLHHLYTPALYEIASVPQEESTTLSLKLSAMININDIVQRLPITFLCDEMTALNQEKKELSLLRGGTFSYEYLVLALGSETNYFDIPGLREHSYPLKTFEDAVGLRNIIEDIFTQKGHLKIVVGGGGSSGVELVAEFINFICVLRKNGALKKTCSVEFLLIEASPDILPGFRKEIVETTKKRLKDLGVMIKANTRITSISETEVTLGDGTKEPYDVLIWTGGVRGPAIAEKLNLPLSPKSSFLVDEYLRVKETNGLVFAIGDNAAFVNPRTGKLLQWNVPVAEGEGRLVAQNIIRTIRGNKPKPFVPWREYPFVLAVGKKYAVADLVYISFSGFPGWILKQLIELRYLLFILPLRKAFAHWLLAVKTYSSND